MYGMLVKINFQEILADVKYLDWHVDVHEDALGQLYLQVSFLAEDSVTHSLETQKGRKWILSPYMTRTEVISTAWKAILAAVEHEARENFRYRGKAIFGPHIDVEALWELCKGKRFDYRKT